MEEINIPVADDTRCATPIPMTWIHPWSYIP